MTFYPELQATSLFKNWLKEKNENYLNLVLSKDDLFYLDKGGSKITTNNLKQAYVNQFSSLDKGVEIRNILEVLEEGLSTLDTKVYWGDNNSVGSVPDPGTYLNFNLDSSEESLKKKLAKLIKPLLNAWVQNNIEERDLRLIYKKWLDSSDLNDQIFNALKNISKGVRNPGSNDKATNWLADFRYKDGTSNQTATLVPFNLFANDLINGTNILGGEDLDAYQSKGKGGRTIDIPALLGLDQQLDSVLGEGRNTATGSTSARTAAELEEALNADPSLFAKITGAAQGQDYKAPTAEELISLRQCALITRLLHDTDSEFSNYFTNSNSPLNPEFEGHQRIYPVDPSYDPNIFYNRCHISQGAKQSLTVNSTADVNNPAAMYKTLFWVFEAHDGKIKEIELALSKNDKEQKETENYYQLTRALGIFQNTNPAVTSPQKLARVKSITGKEYGNKEDVEAALMALNENFSDGAEPDQAYYYLNDIEVKYEGTNPSTARKDVQVQLSFSLSSMKALQSAMATIPSTVTGTTSDVDIKLYDLITLPNTNKISKGPGAYLQNQYSPEYSRVRLKVYTGDGHKCDLIIDLSTIDHTIQRESETGKTTLTINYRGFFEAMMNMPFNDALADTETLDRRKKLHGEAMSIINSNDCSAELISSAMRMEQEIFRREGQSASASSILARLSDLGCIHTYSLKEERVKARAFNGTLDAFEDYVETINLKAEMRLNDVGEETLAAETQKARDGEAVDFEEISTFNNLFFFLGDLLYAVSGCLYKGDYTADMRDDVKNMNMRFMIGSMNVPNPTTTDGSLQTINPVSIPIDVAYFVEWFNSTIVKKGVTTYPVGIFIKELIERLVNNIIFEVCFSSLLPSENPPIIRSTFISNFDDQGWFKKSSFGWFNPSNPYQESRPSSQSRNTFMRSLESENLFKKDAQFNLDTFSNKVYDTNPYNYCIIYQQFPSFSQYTTRDTKQKMRNSNYVPTIFYGAKNTSFNYVSSVGFSKTTAPFLREARYFNSSYGNLSLLSNVYDISFSFIRRKANTFLYPGIIINFALIDWEGTGIVSPYQAVANNSGARGNSADSDDYAILGQNNPHSPKTMAHILGFGGYYIIKSVTYKLGQTEDNFEISVNGTFMGTDAIKKGTRKLDKTNKIEDSEKCVEAYSAFETRVFEVGGDIPESMVAVSITVAPEIPSSGQRTTEVPAESNETTVTQSDFDKVKGIIDDLGEDDRPGVLPYVDWSEITSAVTYGKYTVIDGAIYKDGALMPK